MYNPAGFDSQGLDMNTDLGDPRRQEKLPGGYATQGQAVSAPYAEANMKAAMKTNPMNAVSQEPGKDFLAEILKEAPGSEFCLLVGLALRRRSFQLSHRCNGCA